MVLAQPPAPDLRIGSLFSRSWRAFKTRPWFLAGTTLAGSILLPFLVGFGLGFIRHFFFAAGDALDMTTQVVVTLCNTCFVASLMVISMRIWLGEDATYGMLFAGFCRFWRILGLFFLGLAVFVAGVLSLGFSTAVVTGVPLGVLTLFMGLLAVYLFIAFGPALLVILETRLGVFAALRLSWNLTRGHWWSLFLVVLASTIIGAAGVLAVGVGMLITVPVSQIMIMGAYDELARAYAAQAEAVAPEPDGTAPAEA